MWLFDFNIGAHLAIYTGAATPEVDMTDQNNNVAAGQDKPDQPLPFYVEKEIEKLLQRDDEEKCDTEWNKWQPKTLIKTVCDQEFPKKETTV